MTPTVSIVDAEQVLLPPQNGLAYLRHDRASELRVEPGSVSLADGRIVALEGDDVADVQIDASGCALSPGFIDCHTHVPFAGWRAGEYAMKVAGEPYEEIAAAGGGIRSSARALAAAGDDAVIAQARALAAEMLAHGTTTFETKSGYGLETDAELRALGLADRLGAEVVQSTQSTALLAHAVPDGKTANGWLDEVADVLPRVRAETGAEAIDIFVEHVAFANEHLARVGELAVEHGLRLRAHVEQFNTNRSVPVALAHGARSVDHLACLHPDDATQLAASDCAAVLLPGAEFLGAEHVAPARALADAGAICVLATDANPGTSPIVSLPIIIGLAVRRYGWTAAEALLACTLNAAWVLDCSASVGSIEPGKRADLVLLDAPFDRLPYRLGHNPVALVIVGGEVVHVRPDSAWRVA